MLASPHVLLHFFTREKPRKGGAMPRESKAKKRERAVEVCRRMDVLYGDVAPALHFSSPF